MKLAKYLVERLKLRMESGRFPRIFHATNGTWYSTATGQGCANLEVD